MRRLLIALGLVAGSVLGGSAAAVVVNEVSGPTDERSAVGSGPSSSSTTASSTTSTSTTTTTLPPLTRPPTSPAGIVQPVNARLPAPPAAGVGPGATGQLVSAYQQRLTELRMDPGPVDGLYGAKVVYAVQTLQKLRGLPVTGAIGAAEVEALNTFTYPEPLRPEGEPARTEVDIAKQVLTLYEGGQPRLVTTVSTGSGEHYCYNEPKDEPTERVCAIANTPSGRYTYYLHRPGWDVGVLGGLYNPFYFNGGVAVHGYEQVPTRPASHGCVRIPMHVAEYFPTLVQRGDPVYVFGGQPFVEVSRTPLPPGQPPPPPT